MKTTETLKNLKIALRDVYAWPGGYPLYVLMSDGEAMSVKAARNNWREICRAIIQNDRQSPWHAAGAQVNWDDPFLYCVETNEPIESAYGEDTSDLGPDDGAQD